MRWRVLGSYNPREQWLCTALRRGERRCIDWVRRKELFCANMHLMNIHYHTNLNNLRQLAGSIRASLHFSPHIWLLAEAVAGQCVPALRWAVRQRRPRSHGLLCFFFLLLFFLTGEGGRRLWAAPDFVQRCVNTCHYGLCLCYTT